MIHPKQLQVYSWSDINTELCVLMDIDEKYFGDYHYLVGGGYKDFWHVCLEYIIPNEMHNGSIIKLYSVEDELIKKTELDPSEAWKTVLLRAWNSWYNSVSPNDDGIWVRFSW